MISFLNLSISCLHCIVFFFFRKNTQKCDIRTILNKNIKASLNYVQFGALHLLNWLFLTMKFLNNWHTTIKGGTAPLVRNLHVLCSKSKFSTQFLSMKYASYSKLTKEHTNNIKFKYAKWFLSYWSYFDCLIHNLNPLIY